MSNNTFNTEDLGFLAQVAFAEAARSDHFFEHLMEYGVAFEDMALGKQPADWLDIVNMAKEAVQLDLDVADDILALLNEATKKERIA